MQFRFEILKSLILLKKNMVSNNSQTFDTSHSKRFLNDALRATSTRLEDSNAKYQWGHMGQCNVG